jgi:hypothetical protein
MILRLSVLTLFLTLSALPGFLRAQTPASTGDTLHIKHYSISLDTINFSGKSLHGRTTLRVQSRLNNVNRISLSLLRMVVDEVRSGSQPLPYSYNDTLISITPPSMLNAGDTVDITVRYHGVPQSDPVFGGFTFSGSYAFNIGVGFEASPHNLGKVWFPCIDEFADRATYEFHITTPGNSKAFCNGLLESVTSNPDGTRTYHWKMSQTIPTYLASVAVAPFYTLHSSYKGIPVQWGVLPGDTVNTKKTFAKLDTAMSAYISSYGAYPWEKVGYVSVPFNGGAMEHATSIHIGKVFVDGTLNYETLWAHELSHMWWGDKVTCKTAEDMWLNEGFATYNEARFVEAAYGAEAYRTWIRKNHRTVLQFAHIRDNGYLALNKVPHAYTYGTTVYQKGGDIVHTLRHYMGDAKFYAGCKSYMSTYAYGNADSYNLRDALSSSSGTNMNRFFDDWVFKPGFPHFSIDSTRITPSGQSFQVTMYTRQKQKGTTHNYKMPVECSLTDGVKDTTVILSVDTTRNTFAVTLPFRPLWISLDRGEKISDAVSDFMKTIDTTGTHAFPETHVSLNVKSKGASASVVRVEHNWVKPDPFRQVPPGARISDYHYWTVDGIFAQGFLSKATFTYNGSTNPQSGYIDNTLILAREDSLMLYYRPGPAFDWEPVRKQQLNKGSAVDKAGTIVIDTLKKGQYVLGMGAPLTTSVKRPPKGSRSFLQLYPNPCSELCNIKMSSTESGRVRITDVQGRLVFQDDIVPQETLSWNRKDHTGIYFVTLEVNGRVLESKKLVLEN